MKHIIARSPEEIRAVLETLEGEHLPTRKAYLGSAVSALLLGIIGPVLLVWFLSRADFTDPRSWRSIFTLIIAPILALELLRSMERYIVDDSHIAAIAPFGIGSWTVMRAEIERIEASAGPVFMTLLIHTAMRKTPRSVLLRKKKARELMRIFPELRRAAGRAITEATAEEQARKRKNRMVFGALALFVVLLIAVIAAIEYARR